MTAPLTPASARALLAPLGIDDVADDEVVEIAARVVWNCLTEPGDGVAGAVIAAEGAVGALERVRSSPPPDSGDASPIAAGLRRWAPRLIPGVVGGSVRTAGRSGVRLLHPGHPDWPRALDDLGIHAPLVLWVRGDTSALTRSASVALVGARAATSYGEHVATELAADLAGSGVAVVSGAAYGIDGSAHRAALRVGGTTVALLAGGADEAYPRGNATLIGDIAASGAVVAEVPCGSAPTKWRFLQRNRLIAALAQATVVVEAGWRSGSLNTAGHAAALSRALGAVPGPITSAASAGTHRLLREYGATCITSASDVRELLGLDGAPTIDLGARTDDTTRVRDALSMRSWRPVDEIARRTGMAPGEVEAVLGLLHLQGDAAHDARGWRAVSRASRR